MDYKNLTSKPTGSVQIQRVEFTTDSAGVRTASINGVGYAVIRETTVVKPSGQAIKFSIGNEHFYAEPVGIVQHSVSMFRRNVLTYIVPALS